MSTTDFRNSEFVSDLRQLADICEEHPEFRVSMIGGVIVNVWCEKEEAVKLRRAIGGRWDKDERVESLMILRRDMKYGHVRMEINMSRASACERVVVGIRVIPAQVVPACEEIIVPEQVEEIVEWKCQSLLADEQVPA